MHGWAKQSLIRSLSRAVCCLLFPALLLLNVSAQIGFKPNITVQPLDQIVLDGSTATFLVVATSGTALSYIWSHNGAVIPAGTASSYTIKDAKLSKGDDGTYQVEVINAAGSTFSRIATLTILSQNDVPVANNDAYATQEDTPLTISASGILTNDTDIYPGTLTALLVTNPSNGSLSLSTNGGFTYRPNTNFFGTDSFTYRALDGGTTILEQNSSGGNKQEIRSTEPGSQSFRHGIAGDPSYTIKKVVLRLSKKFNQVNNLNFSIRTGINSGTVAGSAFAIPMSGISNTTEGVSFQNYQVVYSTDAGPFTAGTTYYLNLANSPSGQDVWVELAGSSTYPNGTYYKIGADQGKDMCFEIHENAHSEIATVTLNVTPVNDPPVAVNDNPSTLEDVSVSFNVLANDSDPEGSTLALISTATTNGTAVVSGSDVVFTPATNFNGLVFLSYVVSDGALSTTGLVTVTVVPVNDAPFANDDSTNTLEDTSVTVRVLANDYNPDRSPLMFTNIITTNGTAVISGTNLVFTPSTNFNGTVVFNYSVWDGSTSTTGRVTVIVIPVNDRPVANNDTYAAVEDVPLIIPAAGVLTNDFDVEGSVLTAWLWSNVSQGTLTLSSNGGFNYTPNTNFNGTDSFTYFTHDGQDFGSNVATVTINIAAINDAPITGNDTTNVVEDGSVTVKVMLNDSDLESTPLTITGTSTTNGTAVISGTNVVFTPANNFNGTVLFNYTISDGALSATGRVTVTVTSFNDAPVANDDSTNTLEDVSVTIRVLANDTDVEGTALSLISASTTNGTAVVSGTNIVFTPATNYYGTVVLTYRASDGSQFATGMVTVVVAPVNDGPVATTNTYTTQEDVPLIIPAPGILANDLDIEGDPFSALLVSDVANGLLLLNPDGSFTYTPDADYSGSDSFSYRGTDGLALGNVVTVTINITPVVDLLRFVAQERVTNGMRLELSGPSASYYVIQASSNFTDWSPLSTNFAPQGNLVFIDPKATSQRDCFYRAMINAPTNIQQNATGGTRVEIDLILPGAQSFRYGTNGGPGYGLSKIVIRISRDALPPNGSLIFSVGTGVNSGTLAGSTFAITPGSVTNSTAGTTFQRYEIVLPEPIGPLTAGTTYYLNFVTQSSNGENYWLERSGASTYAPGTFYSAGGDLGRDMRFELWGQ